MTLSGIVISQKHTGSDTRKCLCSVLQSVTDKDKLGQGLAMLLRSLRTNGSESIIVVIYTEMDRALKLTGLVQM